ncbi:MAG TPA: 1-(5-phosphoribosyl)-5-[(5-phosphoribosylamino)methylideneamino]imidazole-4-carboxamide isomerase [Solirubrobacteraceae bacterium]|nr:1-(5-phosphoribosyl)-5-[(5-phosphoribosylamino)methylideneamino]imidazole-4-carboxamide isomerase [Solirubrobacteraceae bacterium]
MILEPAVDILDGRAVRRVQGEFSDVTRYHDDPVEAARAWLEAGARALHVVDLDGARAGAPANLDAVSEICSLSDIPVQLGGGIRTLEDVSAALENGASRVVIGTAAYRDPSFLDAVVSSFGDRVAVAVDVRGGRVSAAGWTEDTGLEPLEAIARLAGRGVRSFVYTNVDRDGMLTGPDLEEARRVADAVSGSLVWSGGVGDLSHLAALSELPIEGVIVGKALYEGRFSVADGQAALGG